MAKRLVQGQRRYPMSATEPTPEAILDRCARCGHPASWHRHDDADDHDPSDPVCPFRCLGYDCMAPNVNPPAGPTGRCCDCPDFVEADHNGN
jgi:hypothetical protein